MSKVKATTAKLGSFAKEVLARLSGDNNEALAQKIARKSMSAIDGQLAALNSSKIDAEMTLENAQEDYNNAKFPTTYNANSVTYCSNLIDALAVVDKAQDDLDDISDSIDIFNAIRSDFTDGTAASN